MSNTFLFSVLSQPERLPVSLKSSRHTKRTRPDKEGTKLKSSTSVTDQLSNHPADDYTFIFSTFPVFHTEDIFTSGLLKDILFPSF